VFDLSEWGYFSAFALLAWIPFGIWRFARVRPTLAAAQVMVWGMMWLPEGAAFDLPVLPPFSKYTIAALTALVGVWWKAPARLRAARIGRGYDLWIVVMMLAQVGTVLTNQDALRYGFWKTITLPGFSAYDGFAEAVRVLLTIAIPCWLGRALLRSKRDLRDVLSVFAVAGVVYSLPILYEVRMSPMLHEHIYGYSPRSDWSQNLRAGGYRPTVFMGHGLVVGFFMFISTIAAVTLHKARKRRILGVPAGYVVAYLFAILVLCKAAAPIIYAAVGFAVVRYVGPKAQARFLAFLAFIVVSYPITRILELFPVEPLVSLAGLLGGDRVQSLQFRFDNEDVLLIKGAERLWFGWGGYSRERVYDPQTAKDLVIQDGHWIAVFGAHGLVGFVCFFALMVLPVLLIGRGLQRLPHGPERTMLGGLGFIVAICSVNMLPNMQLPYLQFVFAAGLAVLTESLPRRTRHAAISRSARPAQTQASSEQLVPAAPLRPVWYGSAPEWAYEAQPLPPAQPGSPTVYVSEPPREPALSPAAAVLARFAARMSERAARVTAPPAAKVLARFAARLSERVAARISIIPPAPFGVASIPAPPASVPVPAADSKSAPADERVLARALARLRPNHGSTRPTASVRAPATWSGSVRPVARRSRPPAPVGTFESPASPAPRSRTSRPPSARPLRRAVARQRLPPSAAADSIPPIAPIVRLPPTAASASIPPIAAYTRATTTMPKTTATVTTPANPITMPAKPQAKNPVTHPPSASEPAKSSAANAAAPAAARASSPAPAHRPLTVPPSAAAKQAPSTAQAAEAQHPTSKSAAPAAQPNAERAVQPERSARVSNTAPVARASNTAPAARNPSTTPSSAARASTPAAAHPSAASKHSPSAAPASSRSIAQTSASKSAAPTARQSHAQNTAQPTTSSSAKASTPAPAQANRPLTVPPSATAKASPSAAPAHDAKPVAHAPASKSAAPARQSHAQIAAKASTPAPVAKPLTLPPSAAAKASTPAPVAKPLTSPPSAATKASAPAVAHANNPVTLPPSAATKAASPSTTAPGPRSSPSAHPPSVAPASIRPEPLQFASHLDAAPGSIPPAPKLPSISVPNNWLTQFSGSSASGSTPPAANSNDRRRTGTMPPQAASARPAKAS
jgi:hypothetical protein